VRGQLGPEGRLTGRGHDGRRGQHRRHGPAAARGHGRPVRRGPRPVHLRVAPALLYLGNVLQIEKAGRELIAAVRRNGARFSVTAPVTAPIRTAIAGIPDRRMAAHRLAAGRLGRPAEVLGLRRRGRRDQLRRVYLEEQIPARHRPAHRPPRPRQEQRRARAGRAVPRLALPRRLHRLPLRARPGRGAASRPRDHRAAIGRPQRRAPRAPALGEVQRQRRLALRRRHRPQPTARRRHPGRPPPRQSPRRHPPPRLVAVAARTARHGRDRLTLHLPEGWHREREWRNLFEAAWARPPQRPDQPRPGPRTRRRQATRPSPPNRGPGQAAQPSAAGRTRPQSPHRRERPTVIRPVD